MNSVHIEKPKIFFHKLFAKNLFDDFLLNEITIVTKNTFHIDGRIAAGSDGDLRFSYWRDLKPICAMITDDMMPLRMKLILSLNPTQIIKLLESGGISSIGPADIGGLYINIKYKNDILTCITGTSLNIFTPDKSLEHYFDKYTESFLMRIS